MVHEAYLKLIGQSATPLANRNYFFAAAARAMRQVLVDAARRRNRAKRGGGLPPETLNEATLAVDGFAAELIDLDAALDELSRTLPRQAKVLECRYFGGLSVEETAGALSISRRTVKRDFAFAQAWLHRELQTGAGVELAASSSEASRGSRSERKSKGQPGTGG